jgi:murein DD-endopeptidase MepM/ murein hydrolase activator NlpD
MTPAGVAGASPVPRGAPPAGVGVLQQAPDPTPPPTGPTTQPTTTLPSSTTTAPASTTTAPASTTTQPGDTVPNPTTTLASPAKPGTEPVGDPVGGGDAGSGDTEVVNPDAPSRRVAPAGPPPRALSGSSTDIVITESATARRNLEALQASYTEASGTVGALERRGAEIEQRIVQLGADQLAAVRAYVKAKRRLADDAAAAYIQVTSGPGRADYFLSARSPNELGTLELYGDTIINAGRRAADEVQDLRRRLDEELIDLGNEKIDVATKLATARSSVEALALQVEAAERAVRVFDLGSEIFISGYVFPVDDPHDFIDSFGAPRMFGTTFAHFHEGTDIMAPHGTALFACETGTIIRMRENVLGGITLKIQGESGTEYYYAHLSAYADGIGEGQPVVAGTVVGFVGNTGNARYTAPHLHYEIHPGGGPAVNPYGLLKVSDELDTAAP